MSIHSLPEVSDDLDDDEFWEADDLEDAVFAESVKKNYPNWYFVQLIGFTSKTFVEVKEWLNDGNVVGAWKDLGWHSHCAYSVGVVFESAKDAIMFKLRWR